MFVRWVGFGVVCPSFRGEGVQVSLVGRVEGSCPWVWVRTRERPETTKTFAK